MVSFQQNRRQPFDHHAFYLDFTNALSRLAKERESVDERRRWSMALREADDRDVIRYVAYLNARHDHEYFQRQHLSYVPVIVESPDAHPQMNVCPADRRLGADGRPRMTRATKWESVPARDYSHEEYLSRSARAR